MIKAFKLTLKGGLYSFFMLLALPLQFMMIGGELPASNGLLTGAVFVMAGSFMALAHSPLSEWVQTLRDLMSHQRTADWESRYPSNHHRLITLSRYIWLGGISGSGLMLVYILGNLDEQRALYLGSIDTLLPVLLALALQALILVPLTSHFQCQALHSGLSLEQE